LCLQTLVVANGGLSNGVEREQLWSLFAKYGGITDIVMKPGKPYAFVSFSSMDDAALAANELNGRLLSHGADHPLSPDPRLYMLFVAECKLFQWIVSSGVCSDCTEMLDVLNVLICLYFLCNALRLYIFVKKYLAPVTL